MITAQGTAQNLETIRVLAVLSAAVAVLFWRTVVKLMIIATVGMVVALMAAGAFVLLESVHR
jgi:hypothetical protein